MNIDKVRMKRHESFSIREGWLTKGLIEVSKDSKVFSSSDATDILGIGTNMVKSLKYWMYATTLIEDSGKNIIVSKLGELINKYDPYFEDIFTWWLIHINFITNLNDSYIFNCFFNKCLSKTFSKQDVYDVISKNLDDCNIDYNEKILQDEVNMIIKTYVVDDSVDNPENNFTCPMSELELIKKIRKDKYERMRPNYKKLDYLVVYYLIQQLIESNDYISIEDVLKKENSPVKLLNLDKNQINEYLDEMKKNDLITINRTAGLNMIYINKQMTIEEIFVDYFSRR